MLRILGATTLVALAGSALAVASPPVQSYDTYKSWFVVCDNALTCVAKSVGDSSAYEITLTREAGPTGKLSLELAISPKTALATMKIDGRAANLRTPAWRSTTDDDITTIASRDQAAIRNFVGNLHQASNITIGADQVVALDGLTAALLRMDDRQGRVGTQTALIRLGARPASVVPPAPTLPRVPLRPIAEHISAPETIRLEAQLRKSAGTIFQKEDCETNSIAKTAEVYALDASKALIFVECLQGAYQASSLAFIVSRRSGDVRQVVLETPYLGATPEMARVSWFTNASFDPKTGELGMFAKGRGLTDCGRSASWIWDGRAFVLSEMNMQEMCGGAEPGNWPTLFRSTH